MGVGLWIETDHTQRQAIMKYIHCFLFFFVLLATPLWAQDPPADPPAEPPAEPNDYSVQLPILMPPGGDNIPASHFEPGGGWNCPCLKTCHNKSGSARTKCEKRCVKYHCS